LNDICDDIPNSKKGCNSIELQPFLRVIFPYAPHKITDLFLNPYFTGRRFRSSKMIELETLNKDVLILILMEDGFGDSKRFSWQSVS